MPIGWQLTHYFIIFFILLFYFVWIIYSFILLIAW